MIKGIAEVWEGFVAAAVNLAHGKKGYGNSHSVSYLEAGPGIKVFEGKMDPRGGIHGVGTGVSRTE